MNDLIGRAEVGTRTESRRKILRAALTCFETMGIEGTSIDDIKQLSGASTGSIYHHFKSKEGLLSYIYSIALADQSAKMRDGIERSNSAAEGVKFLVSQYMLWVESNPKEARLLFRGRHTAINQDTSGAIAQANRLRFTFLIDWLKSHVASGEIVQYSTMIFPSLLIGQAENYCRSWLSSRVTLAPTEVSEQIAEATWRSIKAH